MNVKLFAAVAVLLSLIVITPAQTKREGAVAASPSDAAVQIQKNRLPDSKTRVFEIRTYTTSQKMEVFMAKHGRVTDKIKSQFVSPVAFSPLK